MAGELHNALVDAAVRWLRTQGCSAILSDPFRAGCHEQPDAIGWRDGVSIAVECKAGRSDFLADAKKPHRIDPTKGVGDWRLFATPTGLLSPGMLPIGWGLLEWDGKRLRAAHGIPKGNCHWWKFPFVSSNKRAETQLLVSAIARPEYKPRQGVLLRRGIHFDAWQKHLDETDQPPVSA